MSNITAEAVTKNMDIGTGDKRHDLNHSINKSDNISN